MIKTIVNKIIYEATKLRWNFNEKAVARYFECHKVCSIDDTLRALLSTEKSMCRFGDGEYKVMSGNGNGFQVSDAKLENRLREIIKSDTNNDLMICIPNLREDMSIRTPEAASFWKTIVRMYGRKWVSFLNPKVKYFNAHVTRLYFDYQNPDKCAEWFYLIRQVWHDKDLLIVEGEKSRLGIGNDLFESANSIKRILAPSQNAFACYDELFATVKQHWNGELVLIALGQTATVLAFDLCNQGIRALDVGHIDIEYMWFLSGTKVKTAIAGKYVKEVDAQNEVTIEDEKYLSQIIAKVGVE